MTASSRPLRASSLLLLVGTIALSLQGRIGHAAIDSDDPKVRRDEVRPARGHGSCAPWTERVDHIAIHAG